LKIFLEVYNRIKDLVISSKQKGIVNIRELVIGHSYFLPPTFLTNEDMQIEWLAESYKYQILPILLDYQEQGLISYDESKLNLIPGSAVLLGNQVIGEISKENIITYFKALAA
jgi:hypothetical protein